MTEPAFPCDFCPVTEDPCRLDCDEFKRWLLAMDKFRELQQQIYDPPKYMI